MKLRRAKVTDVAKIHKLIGHFANKKLMLARSLSELYENIQEFFVIVERSKLVGCAAIHPTWEDLAEIKSLAVLEDYQGKGYGSKLLKRCEQEAKQIGIKRIFALSFIPEFFKKHGYSEISRDKLPHKIWMECVRCPLFPDCKEVPLIKII
ncbi:MAG: N-acetyltransferase [Elusimicrobiota bacterium]|nr:N-acetyltransferase [Elusimicrobiota bacterium]